MQALIQHNTSDGAPASYENALESSKFIHVRWVDLNNTVRERVIPVAYFKKLLQSGTPAISIPQAAAHGMVCNHVPDVFTAVGEHLYVLDMHSFSANPYAVGHATVLGYFQEKVALTGKLLGKFGQVDYCSRGLLRSVEAEAKPLGLDFLVGFETEFTLLEPTPSPSTRPLPINKIGYSLSSGLYVGTKASLVLEEIATALEDSGIEVQMYHKETASGQYEVVTGPLTPLRAVDALVHTRETIYNIASKHGLRATLAPRPFIDEFGNDAHTHISVRRTDGSCEDSNTANLTRVEAAFLAGALKHLASIALLTLPTRASYARVADGVLSGGTWVSWGTDNREAPIRLANETEPKSRNFEFKCVDGAANPYLATSAMIGMGLHGIKEGYELKASNLNGRNSAAQMSEEERAKAGVAERLPLSLEEARQKFLQDEVVLGCFGEEFVRVFMSVNKLLDEELNKFDDERSRSNLLIGMY